MQDASFHLAADDGAEDFRADGALSTSAPSADVSCKRCGGSGVVDDGEIDCYSSGIPFENGPIKCVKDCPACSHIGLVKRLRNGGQTDLADMAQALLDGLEDLLDTGYTGGPQGKRARAAIAKATGEQA